MIHPLISVVVPVYNVAGFLEKCVNSILNQTLADFELILVNDGSTDEGGKLCDEFVLADSRVRVIHKENGGLSSARNAGIDNALGEYITFIDSDDYVKETYLEYLYGLIKEYGVKLSVCTHCVVFESGKVKSLENDFRGVMDFKECVKKMLYHNGVDTSSWAKLYHKSVFDNIRFPVGKLFEDIATTYLFMEKAGEIALGGKSQYYYIWRKNSIVNMQFNIKKVELVENTDIMAEYLTKRYPELSAAAVRRCVYARFSTFNQMIGVEGFIDIRQELVDYIKKHSYIVLRDKNTPLRDRVALILIKISPKIYTMFWGLFLKIFK